MFDAWRPWSITPQTNYHFHFFARTTFIRCAECTEKSQEWLRQVTLFPRRQVHWLLTGLHQEAHLHWLPFLRKRKRSRSRNPASRNQWWPCLCCLNYPFPFLQSKWFMRWEAFKATVCVHVHTTSGRYLPWYHFGTWLSDKGATQLPPGNEWGYVMQQEECTGNFDRLPRFDCDNGIQSSLKWPWKDSRCREILWDKVAILPTFVDANARQ